MLKTIGKRKACRGKKKKKEVNENNRKKKKKETNMKRNT